MLPDNTNAGSNSKNAAQLSSEELLSYFALDSSSATALYLQLYEQLLSLIATLAPESRLPSERFLAELLDVSRVTVRNAYKKLIAEKIIRSEARVGVLVNEQKAIHSTTSSEAEIHEMAFGFPYISIRPELEILLFENIPAQKKYWETVIARYNDSSRDCLVKTHWLPTSVRYAGFFNYLQNSNVDLFQSAYTLNAQQAAQKIPDEIRELCCKDNFLLDQHKDDISTKYLIPFDRSYFITYLNPFLLQQCGLELQSKQFNLENFASLFQQAQAYLSEGSYAAGRCWDYLNFELSADATSPLDAIENFTARYDNLVAYKNIFLCEQRKPLDSLELFWKGKLLSLTVLTTHYAATESLADFVPEKTVLLPAKKIEPMCLAINKNSLFPNEAGDVIAFLHEEQTQKLLSELKYTMPPKKEIWIKQAEEAYKMNEAEAISYYQDEKQMKELRRNEAFQLCQQFVIYQCRTELKKYLTEEINSAELKFLLKKKWQNFSQGKLTKELSLCI